MSNHEQYAICLRMIQALSERGSWCGETHIQKASYVMQTLGCDTSVWDFILYKHGPYSFELHSTIDELRQMDFLELKVQPPYGPQIRLSENGTALIHKFADKTTPFEAAIEKTAVLLSNKRVQQLEKLGTVLLLSKEYGDKDDALIARKLNEAKPHISLEDALHAVGEYKDLAQSFAS